MAFHALMWSFIGESKNEFRYESLKSMTEEQLGTQLRGVTITGAVFLGILAVLTLLGVSLQSITTHFIHVLAHTLGIILVLIAILMYWDVRFLWIPTVLTTIFPAVYEATFVVLKLVFVK
jgi:hypothetical protein